MPLRYGVAGSAAALLDTLDDDDVPWLFAAMLEGMPKGATDERARASSGSSARTGPWRTWSSRPRATPGGPGMRRTRCCGNCVRAVVAMAVDGRPGLRPNCATEPAVVRDPFTVARRRRGRRRCRDRAPVPRSGAGTSLPTVRRSGSANTVRQYEALS